MQHQEGPQPLAARRDGIAHGFLDPRLAPRGPGQDGVQGGVHRLGAGGDGRRQQAGIGRWRRRIRAVCWTWCPILPVSRPCPKAGGTRRSRPAFSPESRGFASRKAAGSRYISEGFRPSVSHAGERVAPPIPNGENGYVAVPKPSGRDRAGLPGAAGRGANRTDMRVILAQPRGFCAGVVRAIDIVEKALDKYGEPVYVRHEIVHNKHVVDTLKNKGARFVEELDEVPEGAVTVFSAHGVPQSVVKTAQDRGLPVLDATCPLVSKVHNQGKRYVAHGRTPDPDRPCRPSRSGRHHGPGRRAGDPGAA